MPGQVRESSVHGNEVRPAYELCLCWTNNTVFFFVSFSAQSFYPGYSGAVSMLDLEAEQFFNSSFKDSLVED